MGDWEDNNFPMADDPTTIGWMIIGWRTIPLKDCPKCTRGNYGLRSRQFQHMLKSVNQADAIIEFRKYVRQNANSPNNAKRKNESLFLTKVVRHRQISDVSGIKEPEA